MLTCPKERCREKEPNYIGETERKLKDRICEHIGYINTKNTNQPAGQHFHMPFLKLFLICMFKDPNYAEKLSIWRIIFLKN